MPDMSCHPYTEWEDWKAGMWQTPTNITDDMRRAAALLTDPDTFRRAAQAMLAAWPKAAEQNLTGMQQNRRAWVGQAACCHHANVPEAATRQAWWTLDAAQQHTANQVADQVIAQWDQQRADERTPPLFTLPDLGKAA